MTFDPSLTGSAEDGLFGLPSTSSDSKLIILPVSWDVTTSYGGGASRGPEAVLKASPQLDLFDLGFEDQYQKGFHLQLIDSMRQLQNSTLRPIALKIRHCLEGGQPLSGKLAKDQTLINEACARMVEEVHTEATEWLKKDKIVAVLGGDHSSPEGLIQAVSEHYQGKFSILHIDAHADLRDCYQGFERSHASIMFNVMTASWRPEKLVQVGIRDFCKEEFDMIKQRGDINCFFDQELKADQFTHTSWADSCKRIVSSLTDQVYISFDIDGLDPVFCPSTGTPVPGGLSFDQARFLIEQVARSGKKIIGFDLCEVAPHPDLQNNEWDGNVGARMLYQLCGWASWSHAQRA